MRKPKLTDDIITQHLSQLPGWVRKGDALVKMFTFADFVQAMKFVNQMADYAETIDHHPDIDIRYSKVLISLSTHDAGGITQNDIISAAAADMFATASNP